MISRRVFVSFDEPCFYQCKHCYTFGIERVNYRSINEIVDSIGNEEFDVVYVSQKTDNFVNPQDGLKLCESILDRYKKDLFIITRSVLNVTNLNRLKRLKNKANALEKDVFIAVSINSLQSSSFCEELQRVPSPSERIQFIKALSGVGFKPILMLRPVFPSRFIPVEECIHVIDLCEPYISCVVSSGLGVNDNVLNRLGLEQEELSYSNNQEYLQGAIDCEIKFVDVSYEMSMIKDHCNKRHIRFFEHSMPALNYLALN